ncbi:hypothetical protein SteCoe_20811 [Stentor coeruleus]|uniref:Transmembrane protein 186 n=1 Tax=Stentor coeruleus TaxID=5963 RepID=A0A1R2BR53_9CILI|nr:hypothetical protein SteCoe_20811 [Stentor coeruleus]
MIHILRKARCFSTPGQFFRPNFPLPFDSDGKLMIFTTPSATTFLRVYAPINLGFILVHGYLTLTEYMYPIIPGKYGYLIMTSSLLALGIGIAATVEIFSRRFIKNIYLMNDGKHLLFTFHSAFTFNDSELKIDIGKCTGLDEIYSQNYRLNIPGNKTLYLNLDRNEMMDDKMVGLLHKVLNGFYINTLGEKNINKLFKKP